MIGLSSVFIFQTLIWRNVWATGRITPLIYTNATACIAENLRLTNKYICDSNGRVICLGGWSQPEKLCNTPVCNIEGKTCENGVCIHPNVCACQVGWDGPVCDECIPLGGCEHGSCIKPMECNCQPGWTGPQCSKPECIGCENGCCHEPNKCICDPGWKGINCTECETLGNCRHGKCVNNPFECECDDHWKGNGCSEPICRVSCHTTNGYCRQPGECLCKNGWTGRDCFDCVPYPGCNGTCVNNIPWTCTDEDDLSKPDQWSAWTAWSQCSETCGEGTQRRDRTCPGVGNRRPGSGNCIGLPNEIRSCEVANCPIDGNWSRWTRWSPCSNSCGTGVRYRSRVCSNPIPRHGGKTCQGLKTENLRCFIRPCPINGRWSSWQEWGQCSITCGQGMRQRLRKCDSPPPSNGGDSCFGQGFESSTCTASQCPIDGEWANWSVWTSCSKTCGEGQRERSRTCSEPLYGGRPCPGNSTIERDVVSCYLQQVCSIDGRWSQWAAWSICSTSCGDGRRLRTRQCNNPSPRYGGQNCPGNKVQTSSCDGNQPCPIDGSWNPWNPWNSWTSCSASCNGGTQARQRTCRQPQHGGAPCRGVPSDTRQCGTSQCPVDGVWSQWAQWSTCSRTCDGGTRTRARTCSPPKFGGAQCIGSPREEDSCGEFPCQPQVGHWSAWTQWSDCGVTCGTGTRSRQRTCPSLAFDLECPGEPSEQEFCDRGVCSDIWSQWTQWSACSETCGFNGIRIRTRNCQGPAVTCPSVPTGSNRQEEHCGLQKCPSGTWSQWNHWGLCNVSCGHGSRRRERICLRSPLNILKPNNNASSLCPGSSFEDGGCVQPPCSSKDWAQWGQWSTCSATCGSGVQSRRRTCPSNVLCDGTSFQEKLCSIRSSCSGTIAQWGQWRNWQSCSVTCGHGSRQRERQCIFEPCPGDKIEREYCFPGECGPVTTTHWGQWRNWQSCSVTCGHGSRERERECIFNFSQESCPGDKKEREYCSPGECGPGTTAHWSQWRNWQSCSVTCGHGSRQRERDCIGDTFSYYGGHSCPGEKIERDYCYSKECGIDGGLSEWTMWSQCTVACIGDQGTRTRRKFCNNPVPSNGGADCVGQTKQIQNCTGTITKQETDPGIICYHIGEK